MEYHIEDITSFDNSNGSGILAKVVFRHADHNKSIRVNVRLKLDKSLSLEQVESLAFEEAKTQLRLLTSFYNMN